MKPTDVYKITTEESARQFAIDYQNWASEQNLSYAELLEWQECLTDLAEEYKLLKEFKENGII